MKSKKDYDETLANQICKHQNEMRTMVGQLRSVGILLAQVQKMAANKELDIIEDHIQEAFYEVQAAYGTINQIFTIEG